ncbi:MAG: YHS domain-containing protein, partial [Desulfobulbaceae bacterium]|nr:YHS domain-containing protein [Desulfobulbaceae bacterium]
MTTPTQHHTHRQPQQPITYEDPVCGMSTNDEKTFIAYTHEGKTYFFCSEHCLTAFTKDPAQYMDSTPLPHRKEPDQPVPAADTLYTCPMHPEVQLDKPGTCPKCGMTLEPLTPTVAATKTEYTCPMHPEI